MMAKKCINIACAKLLFCFINQFFFPVLVAFDVIVSSLLLSSRYFATMATWRHTFLSIPQLEDVKMWPLGRNPDCGIREIFVCPIRNLRKFCLWNPESRVCGISNTDQGNRNPTNDLNPESKFLFQRLESIYKGVEKLRKFVHKPHHSSENLAHFHNRTWISILYIHSCFNRKLDNSYKGRKLWIAFSQ